MLSSAFTYLWKMIQVMKSVKKQAVELNHNACFFAKSRSNGICCFAFIF
jgi:hypothetical protein